MDFRNEPELKNKICKFIKAKRDLFFWVALKAM